MEQRSGMSAILSRAIARHPAATRAVVEGAAVAALGSAAGFVNNAVSPKSIPLFGDWAKSYGLPSPGGVHAPSFGSMEIDSPEALRLFHEGVLFLDARVGEAHAAGHIPGALSFPEQDHRDRLAELLDTVRGHPRIAVYCQGMECDESHLLARSLREFGVEGVAVFSGGIKEWREAGHPVEEGAAHHDE